MRLVGQIHITLRGQTILREETFWDKLKKTFGATIDLETDRVRVAVEATALIDQVKKALVRLDFDNAVSLVIDDTVVFQDTDGKAGDLPDLMVAMSEHASLFGSGFKELRLALEHEEAGLHLLVETRATTEHAKDEPSVYVSIGGRVKDLEPRPGEDAEAYRARVEPLVKDSTLLDTSRHLFESFVERLEAALRATIPEAVIEQQRAEALVVRPSADAPAEAVSSPGSPAYDPYQVYYPSPMGLMLDMLLISSFMHMMHPPMIMVVHPSGVPIGSAADVAANPASVAEDAADPGADGADNGDGGGDDMDGGDFDFGD